MSQQPMELPGLSSLTNEQDVGQEGGHVLHEEYEEIPMILDPVLLEEGIRSIATSRPTLSIPSSPEFPLQEPGIPIIIRTDTPTNDDSYTPHSPTNSEYIVWLSDHHLAPHTADRLPHTASRSSTLTPDPQSTSIIRRAATASRDAAAREELTTIAEFYCHAAGPRLEMETSAQYWRRQHANRAETDAINEAEAEAYHQYPLQFEPVWLERYRQYWAHQIEQRLPGVSISTWMEQRACTCSGNNDH
ncbi:hypothetical protein EV421DRAFT_1729479 [Armillaria borealis]|uniref:Uncharacterized protein n=1 Tax=Armillaria borealis TaxID=47425 RepID=A0AA39KBV0_9AGAR|nr:hypothetical protein EV421DRAFT_1729479 [Armillaria borealis]